MAQENFADGKCAAKVVPALRPDKALHIAQPGWNTYIKELGKVAGVKSIATIGDIRKALKQRLDYFESMGCRATDHAWNTLSIVPLPMLRLML